MFLRHAPVICHPWAVFLGRRPRTHHFHVLALALAFLLAACTAETESNPVQAGDSGSNKTIVDPVSAMSVSSSSSVIELASSGSNKTIVDPVSAISVSSSSSTIELASSSSLSFYVFEPGDFDIIGMSTWKGFEGEYFVNTGRDNGTETAGYWFVVDDHEDGGQSTITWPVKIGNEYSEEALDPVIDYCGGICGIFNLRAGSLDYRPFVGVAFNVAGTATATGGPATTTDVTRWGGICVKYASDAAIALELSMGEDRDAALGYDIPFYILPKSTRHTEYCLQWFAFKQAGGGENAITGEDAAMTLATIRFKIQAEDGTVGGFNIVSLDF